MLSAAIAAAYDGVAEVLATDLPSVVPLLRRNIERVPASCNARAAELSWGCELDAALASPDVVLCCELAYWGGWSLLQDDTRLPLRRTLRALGGTVFFAFTLRDADRELGFVRALQVEDGWACRCVFARAGSPLTLTQRIDQRCTGQRSSGEREGRRRAAARAHTPQTLLSATACLTSVVRPCHACCG